MATPNAMWNISYHGNIHFNSIRSPKNPPCPSQDKSDMNPYQAYMQNALDDYQDNFAKLAFLSYNNGTPIPSHDIEPIRATTGLIMLYIADSGAPLFPSYRDWLLSSRTWVGRKYQPKNLRHLPITPKTMLMNYTPHPCHLKCSPLLPSSPPGMLLLPKSQSIPFFPLVKLSHP
jgi:hypothetical protein